MAMITEILKPEVGTPIQREVDVIPMSVRPKSPASHQSGPSRQTEPTMPLCIAEIFTKSKSYVSNVPHGAHAGPRYPCAPDYISCTKSYKVREITRYSNAHFFREARECSMESVPLQELVMPITLHSDYRPTPDLWNLESSV